MTNIPLKPSNETFTDTQWQAIYDAGDNLLVSASAGSGKTTVLVRRVIEKLKSGSNIDELLIVTFTEAAAKEMKERIQDALQSAVNTESDAQKRAHFTRQLQLLPTANISTLHAFCLSIIRRFYYLIDLDPVFRMLTDETETLLLKEEVWTDLRDRKYEENDPAFFQLTENFAGDRTDEGLGELIFALYEFARANPDPVSWLNQLVANYQKTETLTENHLYQTQVKPVVLDDLETVIELLQAALTNAQADLPLEKAVVLLEQEMAQAQRLREYFEKDELDTAYQQLESLVFDRYPAFRKADEKERSQEIKPFRDNAKALLEQLENYFPYPPEKMLELLAKSAPIVAEMASVTQQFLADFEERKLARGVLDFNDLEHFALKILQKKDNGNEASSYYRQKFEEVLVDEYQDVNRLQEAILYWVRNPEPNSGNLFMVGDVKQSIYSFRLADPTLFIEKYMAFAENEGGRRIVLAENFRSRHQVLDFTNFVFQQLMDEKVGQIPYDDSAQLVAGFPAFPESTAFDTELLLYEKESEETSPLIDDKTEGELYITALKIQELITSKFEIYDKKLKTNRPITYRDIVLLTPTKKNNLTILDIFKRFAIPLEVNDAQNYFQATEIQTIIALLQIIDNPYQDIPLVAVLRSPIVGLLEDDLADIRLVDKNAVYYDALLLYAQEKTPLAEKIRQFLAMLEKWREMARRETLPTLLWEIYETTAYLDYVAGLPSGQQRYANLIALIHRAQSYERSSFRGLYQFIRFIEKMQEKDKDLAEPLAIPAEDAVRVMTVHASKGLEFPVVFLLDTAKNFNYQDFQKKYILAEQLGAGIQYVDTDEGIKYDTLPFQAIKQVRLQKALSEEMRKLYVALTRAEQKLYLVGSYKNQSSAFKAWQSALSQETMVLSPALRMSSRISFMDWIGMTLIRHPDMESYFEEAKDRKRTINSNVHFSLHWWNQAQIQQRLAEIKEPEVKELILETVQKDLTADLKRRLAFRYEYPKASETTSYQSVTELKRLYNDPDEQTINRIEWHSSAEKALHQRGRYVQESLAKPRFVEETAASSVAVGTATHTVLQMLSLDTMPTQSSVEQFITELLQRRILSEEIAKTIDISSIIWFFSTELGRLLIDNHSHVKREQPFSMLKAAKDVFADFTEPDADLLVHGIIDGYLELEDSIILYDFKTDAIFGDEEEMVQKIKNRYYGQIHLYAQALEQALKKPVAKAYLVLLSGRKILDF